MMEEVEAEIRRILCFLQNNQQPDGRWSFCFESGPMTDAYMVLLYQLLGDDSAEGKKGMIERLIATGDEGVWKLYPDEPNGNVSATVEAVTALVGTGAMDRNHPVAQRAREFVQSRGGVRRAGSLTRVMLTFMGLYDWSQHPKVPVEFLLLPWWFPVSFFDLVGFTRVHVAPILLASHRRFSASVPGISDRLAGWWPAGSEEASASAEAHALDREVKAALSAQLFSGNILQTLALRKGERFILDRIEPDGTLYSYFSSTWLMIFGWMALGYSKNHPVIAHAVRGLKTFLFPVKEGFHLQETTSAVWDTSLILDALQQAGIPPSSPVVQRGVNYLLRRQHTRLGDWSLRNPGVLPGGWGFSDINTINPDVDDTAACLKAIAGTVRLAPSLYGGHWWRGVHWLLSMQNRDGGWSAFEKNTDKSWPARLLPYQDARTVWTDPSTCDLTGRTLTFIGRELKWNRDHPAVQRAVHFLVKNQESDGSWFGRWGIAYLYGTWAVVTGMAAVGYDRSHPVIAKGVHWLLSVQNRDGGWGESCRSDEVRRYVPLGYSTPSQTAWALDALITVYEKPIPEIRAGVRCLLDMMRKKSGWMITYPTGAGLSGQFYIRYHSYHYIWPLTALSRYRNKYGVVSEPADP
ncbi:terpene cyclase/mutase family protein [Paludifilum halophilum]|uniref:Squalene--hopene cyclase n=1 Tax=Paludifilum halophilum TaxID=1642702 RepID=A0A235B7Q5_9BACL|nr:prenyltransferase/squalene oxidase repeat-containing protein [Paludifilum halophilum]OYD08262.1 hypothetical protein CHM34_05260 [Paludifilum halophilum]